MARASMQRWRRHVNEKCGGGMKNVTQNKEEAPGARHLTCAKGRAWRRRTTGAVQCISIHECREVLSRAKNAWRRLISGMRG